MILLQENKLPPSPFKRKGFSGYIGLNSNQEHEGIRRGWGFIFASKIAGAAFPRIHYPATRRQAQ
jgi:hypothetical protein